MTAARSTAMARFPRINVYCASAHFPVTCTGGFDPFRPPKFRVLCLLCRWIESLVEPLPTLAPCQKQSPERANQPSQKRQPSPFRLASRLNAHCLERIAVLRRIQERLSIVAGLLSLPACEHVDVQSLRSPGSGDLCEACRRQNKVAAFAP